MLLVLTFVPFPFIHPVRVARWRRVHAGLGAIGSVLAVVALMQNLDPAAVDRGGAVRHRTLFLFAAAAARRFAGDMPHA